VNTPPEPAGGAEGSGAQPRPEGKVEAAGVDPIDPRFDPVGQLDLPAYKFGSLSDNDVRALYARGEWALFRKHEELLAAGLGVEERAKTILGLRSGLRKWTRKLMSNKEVAEQLETLEPHPTFDDLVALYSARGLSDDGIFDAIIESALKRTGDPLQIIAQLDDIKEGDKAPEPTEAPLGSSAAADTDELDIGLVLRPFNSSSDRDIFAARTEDTGTSPDGSGRRAGPLDDEMNSGLARINAEDAVWLVAEAGHEKIGMVFGDLVEGTVNVRIWIHPDHRKKGYGTAALRKSRSEIAAHFPAVPQAIRAPGAEG
jgi:GNAT superfamily N-acetyltransferase